MILFNVWITNKKYHHGYKPKIFYTINIDDINFEYRGESYFANVSHYQEYLRGIPRKKIIPLLRNISDICNEKMSISYHCELLGIDSYHSWSKAYSDTFKSVC